MGILTIDQVRELLDSGSTDGEIAAMIGCHRVTVQKFRKKYGLEGQPVGQNRINRPERCLTSLKDDGTSRVYPIKVGKPAIRTHLEDLRADLIDEIGLIVKGWKPAVVVWIRLSTCRRSLPTTSSCSAISKREALPSRASRAWESLSAAILQS